MNKKIFILNGAAGVGKDTFADILNEFIPVSHYSSVSKVKRIAKLCGWNGMSKTEKDRKFLSDLKCLTTEYCDMSFEDIKDFVNRCNVMDRYIRVIIIDIREPADIERAVKEFGAETILIKNDRVEQVMSNMADAGVFEYKNYDYVIVNEGSLDEFIETVKQFAIDIGLIEGDLKECWRTDPWVLSRTFHIPNNDPFEDDLK